MKFIWFSALLIASLHVMVGQAPEQLIASVEDRIKLNDWVQAVRDLEFILDNYNDELTNAQKANIYNDMGYLKMRLLDSEEAEYYLNLSIITHESSTPIDQLAYSKALQNMSQFMLQRVQYDEAKNFIDKAIENIMVVKGSDNPEYALARTKLANIYEEVGYYDLAYDIYYESHEFLKELNDLSPGYAEACDHMGRIMVRRGEIGQAEEFFNESADTYRKLGSDYEVEHAESLEGVGNFYEQLGRYEDAEKILREALAIKRSIPNEANILIIETLNDLGILYQHLGDLDQAETMFSEVVAKMRGTTKH